MPSDSVNNRPMKAQQSMGYPPPPQTEPLPCPRCDSINTKFCYYNNYNLSQPRHFCKSCRRYWTHGGTLRDVPIGGGSRKNSKRSRFTSSSSSSSATHDPKSTSVLPTSNNVNTTTFTSLLSSQGPGFLALGGYGSGPDPTGFDGMGLWSYPEVGELVGNYGGAGAVDSSSSWEMNGGDHGGVVEGDLLAWPDLAISMQGKSLK